MEQCTKTEYRGRCCCNCKYHFEDRSHPCTDGVSVLVQRGWICAGDMHERIAFSGWTAHGMCEMHEFEAQGCDTLIKILQQ